jgi:hypothetical protein
MVAWHSLSRATASTVRCGEQLGDAVSLSRSHMAQRNAGARCRRRRHCPARSCIHVDENEEKSARPGCRPIRRASHDGEPTPSARERLHQRSGIKSMARQWPRASRTKALSSCSLAACCLLTCLVLSVANHIVPCLAGNGGRSGGTPGGGGGSDGRPGS